MTKQEITFQDEGLVSSERFDLEEIQNRLAPAPITVDSEPTTEQLQALWDQTDHPIIYRNEGGYWFASNKKVEVPECEYTSPSGRVQGLSVPSALQVPNQIRIYYRKTN